MLVARRSPWVIRKPNKAVLASDMDSRNCMLCTLQPNEDYSAGKKVTVRVLNAYPDSGKIGVTCLSVEEAESRRPASKSENTGIWPCCPCMCMSAHD